MQRTSTKSALTTPHPFTELSARFASWRESRLPGQRIPEDLWTEAATLARLHGLSPTCTALQLNYYDLQRRMGKPRRTRAARVAVPTFVPLAPPAPNPLLDPDTLEITKPYGARLTFKMPRAKARDLLLWINAFLRS